MEYEGMADSALFEYWFENMLLLELSAGYVIVMDNAAFHRKKVLRNFVSKVGCHLLFLPPYSPDLNPIERLWAWIKHKLKSAITTYQNFKIAITHCFQLE